MNTTVLVGSTIVMMSILAIGLYAGLKVKTGKDFFIAGGKQGYVPIIATQVATGLGSGTMLGWVGFGYVYGFGVMFYGLSAIIGMLVLVFAAGKFMQKNNIYTIPDWLTTSLGEDKWLRAISAIMAMWVLVAAWAAMTVGTGTILNQLTGFPVQYGAIIGGLLVIVYCAIGGLVAVIKTDILCFFFLWLGVIIVLPIALNLGGGVSNVIAFQPTENLSIFPPIAVAIAWFIAVAPGQLTTQTYYQRFAASKDSKVVMWGIYGTVIAVVVVGLYAAFAGMAIRVINPTDLAAPQLAIPWFVTNKIHPFAAIFILGGILAAIVSTSDSMLNSSSSNVARDFYKCLINPEATDADMLRVGRIATVIIGLVGIIIAVLTPFIMPLIMGGYGVSASALVFPLFLAHFWKGTTKTGAITGMIGGFVIAFPATFVPALGAWISTYLYNPVITALTVSLILTVVVSLATKKDASADVQSAS